MVVSCQVECGRRLRHPEGPRHQPAVLHPDAGRPPHRSASNGTPIFGHANDLGVRNTEPGPYNGVIDQGWGDPCGGNRQESGIRVNKSMSPFFILGFPIFCTVSPGAASWNVTGNVFANSPINLDEANAGPGDGDRPRHDARARSRRAAVAPAPGSPAPTRAGAPLANNEGDDPGLVNPTDYAPRSLSGPHRPERPERHRLQGRQPSSSRSTRASTPMRRRSTTSSPMPTAPTRRSGSSPAPTTSTSATPTRSRSRAAATSTRPGSAR